MIVDDGDPELYTITVRDQRAANRYWAHNAVMDLYAKQIGLTALAVYFVLCRHADNEGLESLPSHEAMAEILGTSAGTVKRALATLKDHGLIEVEARYNEYGGRARNAYRLLEPPTDRV